MKTHVKLQQLLSYKKKSQDDECLFLSRCSSVHGIPRHFKRDGRSDGRPAWRFCSGSSSPSPNKDHNDDDGEDDEGHADNERTSTSSDGVWVLAPYIGVELVTFVFLRPVPISMRKAFCCNNVGGI